MNRSNKKNFWLFVSLFTEVVSSSFSLFQATPPDSRSAGNAAGRLFVRQYRWMSHLFYGGDELEIMESIYAMQRM